MNTIVLGYDDTEPAKRALDRTAELARAFQANVVVVSVAPVLSPAGHGSAPSIQPTRRSSISRSSPMRRRC